MHNDCKNLYPQTREEFYSNIVIKKMSYRNGLCTYLSNQGQLKDFGKQFC